MLIISKYLLGTKSVESIVTREEHKILYVRIENEVSDPEIYILENVNSKEIIKEILIVEDNVQLNYNLNSLHFINVFEFRKGFHKFFVFEFSNEIDLNVNNITTRKDYEISNYNNPTDEIDFQKKYARIPKPDLDKIYTEDELLKMHPIKQLRYILIHKYYIKNRICNKISLDKQIELILSYQEENIIDPFSFINKTTNYLPESSHYSDFEKDKYITILTHQNKDPQIVL